MKLIRQSFFTSYLVILINLPGNSQVLNENFNSGLPATWTQSPTATWSLSSNLGTSGSSCIFSQDVGSASLTTTIYTPTLNLSSVTNLTISFKAAAVANNFVGPNVALFFDAGAGPQFIARWGSGFSTNTTYTLMYSSDYVPPLDAQNMSLTPCSHTVASLTGNIGKFQFDAEFVNGGYLVLEDILITGVTTVTTGIQQNEQHEIVTIFPNPSHTKKIKLEGSEIKDITIYDNLGKSLNVNFIRISEGAIEIDMSKFSNGIYYLNATTKENVLIRKKVALE